VIDPPRWTAEVLEADRQRAIALFRSERLDEPLEDYLEAFDKYRGHVEELLEKTGGLSDFESAALEVFMDEHLLEAFRYLAGPPISEDDLKVLAEAPSLAKGRLRDDREALGRLIDVVRQVLDRRRFTWVVEGRAATEAERGAAVIASAALMAASRVQTKRRNTGKNLQEARVKKSLADAGLTKVRTREIPTLSLAPAPGEFCGESKFGNRKADIVVRLWDERVMPIECKVSNSSLNSVKRLNNDAAVKAGVWVTDFGRLQVVPAAVLGGVYDLRNLMDVQNRGLTIFWTHDLSALTNWVGETGQER
jgi:hypothetical protein